MAGNRFTRKVVKERLLVLKAHPRYKEDEERWRKDLEVFANRSALRAFVGLGRRGHFRYWEESKRKYHFQSLEIVVYAGLLYGEKDFLSWSNKRIQFKSFLTNAADAAAVGTKVFESIERDLNFLESKELNYLLD